MQGWTNKDAVRFLKALGITRSSLGSEEAYKAFVEYEYLPDAFKEAVRGKLEHLGFDPATVERAQFALHDADLKEAMHVLVEAHRRGFENHMETKMTEWLAECNKALAPDIILQESIYQAEQEFGEYLNYAAGYCKPNVTLRQDAAILAKKLTYSALATFDAMQTIVRKCGLPPTASLHPFMEQVARGEILVPMAASGTARRH